MIVYLPVYTAATYQNKTSVYKLPQSCTEIKEREKNITVC